ncbi:hypothetical protein MRB53_002043 [Persea americana]|uniref:Uncharacterized protein n=1 Tax=Persea americana TaxID=3435 RepID=A0ACC2MTN8_PERAE|nr:hypothetical protein MRB53_002043 [Persea americana]
MALKTVHVSDVPSLDHVRDNSGLALSSATFSNNGCDGVKLPFKPQRFMVVGHRGSGMNMDLRMKAIKENSILSFNEAGKSGVDFVEFDVQVTKDDCPIIFHDDFILTEEDGCISEKRVTELSLKEFLHYGPQREPGKEGKPLLRKAKDGKIYNWKDEELVHILQVILQQVVFEYANDRPIIFSSFQPDAVRVIRKLQDIYPVFFLTNGGCEVYSDMRRNSLDEAIKICLMNGLQGIVSEVRAIFRNPGAIPKIKEANLTLLTYGQLNNVPEAVYMQHLMGIDGVIVDQVKEITEVVSEFTGPATEEEGLPGQATTKPNFSQRELSFLLKLIPELIKV